MASNQIPSTLTRLVALAEDAADGAQATGASIPLVKNTEVAIRADLISFQAAEAEFQAARAAKAAAATTAQVADSNAKAFLAAYKKLLSFTLGNAWSAAWTPAGWVGPSLELPSTLDARLTLLATAKAFLTANPASENPAPAVNVTAARADALHAALSDARAAVNAAAATAGQKKAARDAAVETLRARLIGLVRELDQELTDDDPRWYAFGLNRPGDPSTPAVPAALTLTPGGPSILLVDWADARRAERYKVQRQTPGATPEWAEVAQVTESETTLTGLPTGVPITLRVLAANAAGDSQPGEPVTVTL